MAHSVLLELSKYKNHFSFAFFLVIWWISFILKSYFQFSSPFSNVAHPPRTMFIYISAVWNLIILIFFYLSPIDRAPQSEMKSHFTLSTTVKRYCYLKIVSITLRSVIVIPNSVQTMHSFFFALLMMFMFWLILSSVLVMFMIHVR